MSIPYQGQKYKKKKKKKRKEKKRKEKKIKVSRPALYGLLKVQIH
jgi:hypothetical protein